MITLRKASSVEPKLLEWLWPSRIPKGKITVLAGNPGVGKGLITCDLTATLTIGRKFPDCQNDNTPIEVAMLACEDGEADTIRPRLEAAGADLDRVHFVDSTIRLNSKEARLVALDRDVSAIREVLKANPKIVPGCDERKRRTVSLGLCSSRTIARRKLREHIEREGINSKEYFNHNARPAVTFGEQAERWLAYMAKRRRKPVKPATIARWRYSLDNWLLPNLADKPLADVTDGVLRDLIGKLTDSGLAPASIIGHVQVVKLVVASAVDDDGEEQYPRKWNHDFIELPIVRKEDQHRPTVTASEVEEILASAKRRYAVLFALLAGSGLRIGEALALKISDLSPDCRVLRVERSIWHGREQAPKTPNAIREIDIAEQLAQLLSEHVSGRNGYVFATSNGTPLGQRNVLRALHATGKKIGFHSFRRFRTEVLRRARVPELDLVKPWLGHSKQTVTDFYADGLRNDTAWRREWCDRAGLGFSLDGLLGLQNVVAIDSVRVA